MPSLNFCLPLWLILDAGVSLVVGPSLLSLIFSLLFPHFPFSPSIFVTFSPVDPNITSPESVTLYLQQSFSAYDWLQEQFAGLANITVSNTQYSNIFDFSGKIHLSSSFFSKNLFQEVLCGFFLLSLRFGYIGDRPCHLKAEF
jgi:hypothetical protein